MSCARLLFISLTLFTFSQDVHAQSISSIQRIVYGSALIDSVPVSQFPRGGSYTAIIQGSGLAQVTGFATSNPNVSGSVISASDTSATVQISSTSVKDGDDKNAPIPSVSFALFDSSGNQINSPVTFDIVADSGPQVTSWKLATPAVKWIPGGSKATVTYLADLTSFGNVQFVYVAFQVCCFTTPSWTYTGDQFTSHWTVVIDVTPTTDFGTTNFPFAYGAVDGAGLGGTNGTPTSLSPSKPINIPIVQVQLVDPVPDLVSDGAVVTDSALLSDQGLGKVVRGAAADGVSTLLTRIAGAPPDETFSLSLDQDGTLIDIGTSAFGSSIAVQADSSGNAFVLYRAPVDFTGVVDDDRVSRIVNLSFGSNDNPGVTGDTPITIVRPPIILVHGNWSDAGQDWRFFQFLQSPFQMFRVDYSKTLAQGVIASSSFVLAQVPILIDMFKAAAATDTGTSVPVAAVQADFVAYSMGGLVTRALVTVPSFANSYNFNSGYLHKLITLDTPHWGTPLADALLNPQNAACRETFERFVGPVAQNIQDMATTSPLIELLATPNPSAPPLPTAVIASSADVSQIDTADHTFFGSFPMSHLLCRSLLPRGGFQAFFTIPKNPSGASDLIVPNYSQLATGLGIGDPIPSASFSGIIHDVNPFLFPEGPDVRQSTIGTNPKTLEEDRVGVPPGFRSTEEVKRFLNTPIDQFGKIAP